MESMAIKHFGMSLNDPEGQYEMSKADPESLEEAVQLAQVRENCLKGSQIKVNQMTAPSNDTSQNSSDNMEKFLSKLTAIQEGVKKLSKTVYNKYSSPKYTKKKPPKYGKCGGDHPIYVCVPCFTCGGTHFNIECPQRKQQELASLSESR
jgi:hypothetical protein